MTFVNISPSDVTTTINYASNFIGDLMPIILPLIGLMVGIIILHAVIRIFR